MKYEVYSRASEIQKRIRDIELALNEIANLGDLGVWYIRTKDDKSLQGTVLSKVYLESLNKRLSHFFKKEIKFQKFCLESEKLQLKKEFENL